MMKTAALIPVSVAVLASVSCRGSSSQIVLVVDSDLAVPAELDHIQISVEGPAAQSPPIDVELRASGAPTFPLTLGLLADGALAPLAVRVAAFHGSDTVVIDDAATGFVEGEERMLRMVLLASCAGVICADGESCGADGCAPRDLPAASLPRWTGSPPARPVRSPEVQGRTVWASGWHSAAIDGANLYGWGQNADGQLGNGATQNANSRRLVMNIQNPASVGLGQLHSCVCDQSKQAWCWGRNAEGQLGAGDTNQSLLPAKVPGLDDCEQIAGGSHHACAVRTDKTVVCWGQNGNGQTGMMGTDPVTSPTPVPGLADVVEVRCGEFYSCARQSSGDIWCWGKNDFGQLGDGTTTSRAAPEKVSGLAPDIVELTTGRFFVCVRHASGQVSCWGAGGVGQLGSAMQGQSSVPVDLPDITDALQLAAGQQHACAIRRNRRSLVCWGANGSGQLGDGTTNNSAVPVEVLDLKMVTSIAAGSIHTCARHSTGLSCFGDNVVNQLGDGSTTNRSRPVSVAGF